MTDKETRVAIENWLATKGSPLNGYADYLWVLARVNGISGTLTLGIAQAETQCGTDNTQNPYNLPGHNVWGYGYDSDKGHSLMFPTWPDTISSLSRYLATAYVYNGFDTVDKIGPKWTGNPTPTNWINAVKWVMTKFGGNPDKLARTPLMTSPPPQPDLPLVPSS